MLKSPLLKIYEDDKKLLALTAKQMKILMKYIDFLSEIEKL